MGQSKHKNPPTGMNLPTPHAVHAEAPYLDHWPAGQFVQTDAPELEYVPE